MGAATAATAAKERPILFSGPMIQAIRAGRKTQTRRVIPNPVIVSGGAVAAWRSRHGNKNGIYRCPHGKPGDRLWCRESHRFPAGLDGTSAAGIATSALIAGYARPWAPVLYTADGATRDADLLGDFGGAWGKARPSIHMPRWASRILLEVAEVRVERLQDISEADAYAEGIPEWKSADQTFSPIVRFRRLWESINGPGSWGRNDWLWVIGFRVLEGLA